MGTMQRSDEITARAPGKINVYFRVGDDPTAPVPAIAALYQAVSVFDEVTVAHANEMSVSVSGIMAGAELPIDDRNTAVRAAAHLARVSGYSRGAHLHIEKRIPLSAGMGGGSADAAAALLACNALWQLGLERKELQELAAELGCDVSVALEGGTVVGNGFGESLSQALTTGTFHWVVVIGETHLHPQQVMRALIEHRARHSHDIPPAPHAPTVESSVLHAVRSGCASSLAEVIHSDFQVACLRLAPTIIDILEFGESRGALAGIVSGSSSSLAFLAEDKESAAVLVGAFERDGLRAISVSGPVPGAKLVTPEPLTVA